MASGCGISRKNNRKVGTTFLYFWWYKDGMKQEHYLGRADDRAAELNGLQLMLSFFRKQDADIHQKIGNIIEQLATRYHVQPLESPSLDYLPETEE